MKGKNILEKMAMVKVNKNSYLGLLREEKDGSYLCIPAAIEKPIFFNKTLYEIFGVCGNKTIPDIKNYMINKYPEVARERIEQGVHNGIWYLRNIGLVSISGEFIMKENKNIESFEMPSEWDFEVLSDFLKDKMKQTEGIFFIDISLTGNKHEIIEDLCSVERLRFNHAIGKNMIYKYSCIGSDGIDGMISFSLHAACRVAYIHFLATKSHDVARQILDRLFEVFTENQITMVKVRFTNLELEEENRMFFLDNEFNIEATLKDESIFGDLNVYSYDLRKI